MNGTTPDLSQLCVEFLRSVHYAGDANALSTELLAGYLGTDTIFSSTGEPAKEMLRDILLAIKTNREGRILVPDDCLGALNVLVNMALNAQANYEDHGELDYFEVPGQGLSVFISHEDVDNNGKGCSSVRVQLKEDA